MVTCIGSLLLLAPSPVPLCGCDNLLIWMAFGLFPFSELMNQLQVPSCAGLFLVNLIFAFLLGE